MLQGGGQVCGTGDSDDIRDGTNQRTQCEVWSGKNGRGILIIKLLGATLTRLKFTLRMREYCWSIQA